MHQNLLCELGRVHRHATSPDVLKGEQFFCKIEILNSSTCSHLVGQHQMQIKDKPI